VWKPDNENLAKDKKGELEGGRQAGRQAGEGVTEEEKEEEEEILCVPYAPRRFVNEQRMKAMRPPHQQSVLRAFVPGGAG